MQGSLPVVKSVLEVEAEERGAGGMVLVPAGSFNMGSEEGGPFERPVVTDRPYPATS